MKTKFLTAALLTVTMWAGAASANTLVYCSKRSPMSKKVIGFAMGPIAYTDFQTVDVTE